MYIRFPPLRISFLESACSLTGQGDEEALWASRSTTGQVSRSASGVSVVTPWVFDILRWLVEGVFDVFLMWWYFMIDAIIVIIGIVFDSACLFGFYLILGGVVVEWHLDF